MTNNKTQIEISALTTDISKQFNKFSNNIVKQSKTQPIPPINSLSKKALQNWLIKKEDKQLNKIANVLIKLCTSQELLKNNDIQLQEENKNLNISQPADLEIIANDGRLDDIIEDFILRNMSVDDLWKECLTNSAISHSKILDLIKEQNEKTYKILARYNLLQKDELNGHYTHHTQKGKTDIIYNSLENCIKETPLKVIEELVDLLAKFSNEEVNDNIINSKKLEEFPTPILEHFKKYLEHISNQGDINLNSLQKASGNISEPIRYPIYENIYQKFEGKSQGQCKQLCAVYTKLYVYRCKIISSSISSQTTLQR